MTRKLLTFSIFSLLVLCRQGTCEVRKSCKFDSVRVCDHFVDKSEIINVVFNESASTRCFFLSTAHGFGTSVNLGVLDMFACAEFNLAHQHVPVKQSYAYSIFKDNFKISQYKSLIDEHLGQYIVVPLRLQAFLQNKIIDKHIAWNLNMMISWSNKRWRWVGFNTRNFTTSDETSRRDFAFLQKLIKTKFRINELPKALESYVELLHRYFNRKIIIMVDDYDRVFRHAVHYMLKRIDLYYSFLNKVLLPLIQDNDKVYKVIITGTTSLPLYLGKCSLAPLVEKYTFLNDHLFSPFFGFDDQEIDELFNKFNIPLDEKPALGNLANGYKTLTNHTTKYNSDLTMMYFRSRRNLTDDDIFNFTVAQKKADEYELYFPTLFLLIPPFRYKIIELIHKLDIKFNLVEYDQKIFDKFADLTIYEYYTLANKKDFNLDLLFTYLFEQGYLGLANASDEYHLPNTAALNDTWTAVKIFYKDMEEQLSLNEIASSFKKILTLFENNTQINVTEEVGKLQAKLNYCFKILTNDEHFQELRVPEYQFHSVVLAAIVSSTELNLNEDELEAFCKSFIQFSTPNSTTNGIIEIKYGGSAEQALQLALSSFISDPNVTDVKYIGINVDQQLITNILVQHEPECIEKHEQNSSKRK